MKELKSSTWRELETNGKFTKNDKLTFISDEMLIIGCDIGCETHYIRAVDFSRIPGSVWKTGRGICIGSLKKGAVSGRYPVACSGKYKGETKISHRGRKKLRYWLFQAAKSAVSHSEEFKTLHMYYTTRADNPLKKMLSLIVIACKILKVFYAILKHGTEYDLEKMMKDIKHPAAGKDAVA